MNNGGFSIQELLKENFKLHDFKKAGFSAKQLNIDGGFSAVLLKYADFSIEELKKISLCSLILDILLFELQLSMDFL